MKDLERFFRDVLAEIMDRAVEVTMEIMMISSLQRSPRYQRNIQRSQIDRMLEEFNPFAIGILIANVRPGKTNGVLVDGNHRSLVLKEKGYIEWPCLVTHGLSEQEEARLWGNLNKNRGVPNSGEVLKAKLVAKDPDAIQMVQCVHAAGMRFEIEKGASGQSIKSVAAFMKAQKEGILEPMVRVVSEAWPGDPYSTCGKIVNGLFYFLRNKEARKKVDVDRLISVLKTGRGCSPQNIMDEADRKASGTGNICRMVANAFKDRWNNGLRGSLRVRIGISHDFFEKEFPTRQKDSKEESANP